MKDFYELTNRGRALRLRKMALQALERYDLELRRVRLLTNDMNGIFRVDTADGQKCIVRVTMPEGGHALEEIRSEMKLGWSLDDLYAEASIERRSGGELEEESPDDLDF